MPAAPDRRALEAIRAAAHRLTGAPDDFDAAARRDRRRARRAARRGVARHARVLSDPGGDHQAADPREGLHGGRRRGRLARRLPRQPLRAGPASVDDDAEEALSGSGRFPHWMWRNADVLDFVGWLRAHNDDASRRTARSASTVSTSTACTHRWRRCSRYLDQVDPEAARRARRRYGCFDHFGERSAGVRLRRQPRPRHRRAKREVVRQLLELHRRAPSTPVATAASRADDFFFAEQNARLVQNAEEYYRTMFRGPRESWNLRDRHMVETLEALWRFLESHAATTRRSWSGRTTRTSATRGRPRWAAGRAERRAARARTRPPEPCSSGSRRTPER